MKKVVSIDYEELQLLYANLKAFEESNSDKLVVANNLFDRDVMLHYQEYHVYTKDELVLKLINNIVDVNSQNIKLQCENQSLKMRKKGYLSF